MGCRSSAAGTAAGSARRGAACSSYSVWCRGIPVGRSFSPNKLEPWQVPGNTISRCLAMSQ